MDDITPKKIALVVAGSLLTIGILFGAWYMTSAPKTVVRQDIPVRDTDYVAANKKAKVMLVEYSDFQCPACGQYHSLIKQVLEKYKDQIGFVQRHFPLQQHENAIVAARAAEAAGKQGKFYEMGDLLFTNQKDWEELDEPVKTFEGYANKLKLNMDQFKKDNTDAFDKKIEADRLSGVALGVNSTPTFFLNGVKLSNPGSMDAFSKLIDAELAASK